MSASVLDVGAQRREEASQTIKATANLVLAKPYRGQFLMAGAPVVLFGGTPVMTGKAFADGVVAACKHWGAEIVGTEKAATDILQVVATITEDVENKCDPRTVMEAVAETVRVLLAGAIIAAKDDVSGDDAVLVNFRAGPRFEIFPDEKDNVIYVAGRVRVGVTRKNNPALSYLLGSNPEESQTLNVRIPDSRLFIGPNRLRFLDLRSPGHLVEEELIRVSA